MENPTEERRRLLRENLERVLERIREAARRSGRGGDAVTLVAVTKQRPLPLVMTLAGLGQRDLGENRPEAVPGRARALEDAGLSARWHMIGHVQRRKVRASLPHIHMVHSVHNAALLERLAAAAAGRPEPLPVLIQVNLSGEPTKQGVDPDGARELLEQAGALPVLRVEGLMTMAPLDLEEADLRRLFAATRELRDRLACTHRPLPHLSMGMSRDFEAAILEGATLVRIGGALFRGTGPGPEGQVSPGGTMP